MLFRNSGLPMTFHRKIKFIAISTILFATLACCDNAIDQATYDHIEQTGSVIVEALQKFRSDHDRLPNNLNDLIDGGYIKSLPNTKYGSNKWEFVILDKDRGEYELSAGTSSGYPCVYYSSKTGRWHINQ